MANTEVLLIKPVEHVGGEGDQVRVKSGYARNFLLPRKLAVPVNQSNKRQIEALRKAREQREAKELDAAQALAAKIQKAHVAIAVKTGEGGKMFGAVTAGMIADELKHQFDISLDRKKIHLEHPIKTLGDHEVEFICTPMSKAR